MSAFDLLSNLTTSSFTFTISKSTISRMYALTKSILVPVATVFLLLNDNNDHWLDSHSIECAELCICLSSNCKLNILFFGYINDAYTIIGLDLW